MAERLVPDLFLFYKNLYDVNTKDPQFQYILIVINLAYNKNRLYKTLDYWPRDMLYSDFS